MRSNRLRTARNESFETAAALSVVVSALLLAVFAFGGEAQAASVTYVGSDGNVRVASPDGAINKAVTTAGTADSPFRMPTAKNDGTIAATRAGFVNFVRPTDGAQIDAWILPKTGAGSFTPYSGGHVSPDGGLFIYDWRYFDCATNPCQGNQRVSFIGGPGVTNPCLINCHVGWIRPRWVPGTPYAGMVSQNFTQIGVQKAGAAGPVVWLQANQPQTEIIDSFDVSSTGRTVVETSPPGGGASNLVVFQNNGTPPAGNPVALCALTGFAGDFAFPRWSPDGSMIAWKGAAGIYVSPAPTTNGGVCGLQPKLIGPGGSEPSWGLANAPAPVTPPPPPPPPKDPPKKDDPKTGGGTSNGSGNVGAVAGKKCKKAKKKKGKKAKKKKGCK